MTDTQNTLEHLNITVSNPAKTAKLFCTIFDWQQRWAGPALDDGTTIHVGGENSYLALYSHSESNTHHEDNYKTVRNLNHIGIVVDDLALIEKRIIVLGLKPFNHREYNPGGKRFYFSIDDDIEVEVTSYN
jgi:hypothetical protein